VLCRDPDGDIIFGGTRCETAALGDGEPTTLHRNRLVWAPSILRGGLSSYAVDGRIPVDVSAEHRVHFSAELRGILSQDDANRLTSCWNPRCSFDYAFSATCNSATLKGTPHPPIPQYPSGFFAKYCW
jgi:hypothetical protein